MYFEVAWISQNTPTDPDYPTRYLTLERFPLPRASFTMWIWFREKMMPSFVVRSKCEKETLPHAARLREREPLLLASQSINFETTLPRRKTAREGFDFVAIWLQRPFLLRRSRRQSPRRPLMAAECWQPAPVLPATASWQLISFSSTVP